MDDIEDFLSDPVVNQKSHSFSSQLRLTRQAEREMLIQNPHSYIRNNVKTQVQDCLWMVSIRDLVELLEERKVYRSKTLNRCIVCTLPLGTCEHSREWDEQLYPKHSKKQFTYKSPTRDEKDKVSQEIDDVMDLLGGGVKVETELQVNDVDIKDIRWSLMMPRLSDKIGDTYIAVSTPTPRGWHTVVSLGKYLVLFGGFRYKKKKIPQPFASATKHEDVEYLNDLYVYDTEHLSWHNPGTYYSTLLQYSTGTVLCLLS